MLLNGLMFMIAFNFNSYRLDLSHCSLLQYTGAATTLLCALDPEISPGTYYADCCIKSGSLHPKMKDEKLMKQLWTVSEELVK